MTDFNVRGDLLRLGVLLLVIFGMMAGLKIYDNTTGVVGQFGAKFFDEIIQK